MPSALALPTIADLVTAGSNALVGERDRYGDKRSGAIYNHIAGTSAVLFSQEADRDRDAFQDIYFDDAQGDALTQRLETEYGIPRILDAYGVGAATFVRPTAAAGAGTIWTGTRIFLGRTPPFQFVVSQDTPVSATALQVYPVPIRAAVIGTGQAATANSGLALEDAIFDATLVPTQIVCADGTDFEEANAYRARVRQTRINDRNGYVPEFVIACQAVGASYVMAFASNYGLGVITDDDFNNDFGLNALYVADQNYQSTPLLVNACTVALESARVLGADLYVGGIVQTRLVVSATVTLVDDPGKLDIVPIRRAVVQALLAEFTPTSSGYLYKLVGLAGAMTTAHPAVQTVTFALPTTEPSLSPTAWPAALPRYTLAARDINLTFAPPV